MQNGYDYHLHAKNLFPLYEVLYLKESVFQMHRYDELSAEKEIQQ